MVGLVQALDALEGLVDRDALAVDFLGVADHARDRAQAASDAHGAGIGKGGQAALEHARIELIGLSVHVDETAREMGVHQRVTLADHAGHQLVDEAVLGAPQGGDLQPGHRQEGARVDRAAVGRVEQHRAGASARLHDLERRVQLVAAVVHGCGARWARWAWRPPGKAANLGVGWSGAPASGSIVHIPWDKAKQCFRVHPLFTRGEALWAP